MLIDALTGPRRSLRPLRGLIERGERLAVPALVLYEWLRGPRVPQELADQDALFPAETAIPFGPREAALAADLYRAVRRPRGREVDLAIAACALTWGARLWTLDGDDFRDIPGLQDMESP